METPQTFTDWIVGPMTKDLQTIGSDEFLDVASKKGLTYVDYNADFGTPIEYRVGRHLEGAKEIINWANMMLMDPEKEVQATWPGYDDLMDKKCGYFLKNPETADSKLVFEI